MGKKVIVIGSGGREHALAWKLSASAKVSEVFIAPGNGGTSKIGTNLDIMPNEKQKIVRFCRDNSIDLAVIGPDDALADGLADELKRSNVPAFGPTKKAARIESSKAYAKDMMKKMSIPTARYETFNDAGQAIGYVRKQDYPLVVKASGLALGKGVMICENFESAQKAIESIMLQKVFKDAGETVVVEEFLSGSEVSFHAISDGKRYVLFPASQDHKQAYDGDKGPNTGGMGAYGPISRVSDGLIKTVNSKVIGLALKGLSEDGSPFAGCLYPGLMLTAKGPMVLEYNARFGDPETQVYMRLLDSDLFDLLDSCVRGKLNPDNVKWKPGFGVSVVLASGGYPSEYKKGIEIKGLDEAEKMAGIVLFHAGTRLKNGKTVTSGGRVINVTAYGGTLDQAIDRAYKAANSIHFDGMHYRKDIGQRKFDPKVLG